VISIIPIALTESLLPVGLSGLRLLELRQKNAQLEAALSEVAVGTRLQSRERLRETIPSRASGGPTPRRSPRFVTACQDPR
jgi:hypothetical protein